MNHPWLDIPISDYEAHIDLPSVRQAALLASIASAHAKRMPGPSTETNTTATIAAVAIHPQLRAMGIGSSPVGAKSGSRKNCGPHKKPQVPPSEAGTAETRTSIRPSRLKSPEMMKRAEPVR